MCVIVPLSYDNFYASKSSMCKREDKANRRAGKQINIPLHAEYRGQPPCLADRGERRSGVGACHVLGCMAHD